MLALPTVAQSAAVSVAEKKSSDMSVNPSDSVCFTQTGFPIWPPAYSVIAQLAII